jgi:hypothetical protein
LAATAAAAAAATDDDDDDDDDEVAVCFRWCCMVVGGQIFCLFVRLSREHHKEGITFTLQVFPKMDTRQISAIH